MSKPLLALLATLFALGIAECAVRLLRLSPDVKLIGLSSDDTAYQRSTNPLLSFELKANYRNPHPDLRQTYARTNSHGQRDLERTLAKPSGVRRILLLGDSVVEGYGVDEESTISRQMEKLLGDPRTEVLNFGVMAYCTRAEVELLEAKGLGFQPDIVVLVFVENDFENFNREAFQLAGTIDRPALVKQLFLHSQLFRLASIRWNLFQYGAEVDPVRWNKQAMGENNVVEGLKRIKELSDRYHFRPLIAIWPSFTDDGVVDLRFMPGEETELVVERLARMHGLLVMRLSAPFRDDWRSKGGGGSPRLLYSVGDGMHPSAVGSRVAAESILRLIDKPEAGSDVRGQSLAVSGEKSVNESAIKAAAAQGREAPNYTRVYTNIANRLFESGRFDEAKGYYESALREDPNNFKAHLNLATVLRKQNKPQEALEHLRAALQISPHRAETHYHLGSLQAELGNEKAAIEHLERAIAILPTDGRSYLALGTLLEARGDLAAAAEKFEQALQNGSGDAQTNVRLGGVFLKLGNATRAQTAFEAALKLDPRQVDAHLHLGMLLGSRGDLARAAAHLGTVLETKPDDADALNNLGVVLARQGELTRAAELLEKAARLRPGDAEIQGNQARVRELLSRQQ